MQTIYFVFDPIVVLVVHSISNSHSPILLISPLSSIRSRIACNIDIPPHKSHQTSRNPEFRIVEREVAYIIPQEMLSLFLMLQQTSRTRVEIEYLTKLEHQGSSRRDCND